MSTIDFNSLSRAASHSLQPGMLGGPQRDSNSGAGPSCNLPGDSVHSESARQASDAALRQHDARQQQPERNTLNAPLSDVAKLHTEAERSMSTGLSSAVARAVDGPATSDAVSNTAAPSGALPTGTVPTSAAPPGGSAQVKPREFHRVREVRREQGVSIKRASQHLGCSVDEARRQEEPTTDLTMSQLLAWQKLCEVPVGDLLVEPDCDLSAPVLQRARMVRVMKTVQAIMERTGQVSVKRLGQTLVNQLVELMPELKGVSSWHAVERRQSCNQNARILESNYLRPADEEQGG